MAGTASDNPSASDSLFVSATLSVYEKGHTARSASLTERSYRSVSVPEDPSVSADQYNHAMETILYSIANVNSKLDDYKGALPYLKQLKDMFPRKDDYRQAYIGCLGNTIAKYTNPVYIVIAILEGVFADIIYV